MRNIMFCFCLNRFNENADSTVWAFWRMSSVVLENCMASYTQVFLLDAINTLTTQRMFENISQHPSVTKFQLIQQAMTSFNSGEARQKHQHRGLYMPCQSSVVLQWQHHNQYFKPNFFLIKSEHQKGRILWTTLSPEAGLDKQNGLEVSY